jgi:hypothetical protein
MQSIALSDVHAVSLHLSLREEAIAISCSPRNIAHGQE